MKIEKSERGIYEPVLTEEDVVGQIRQLLETMGAVVTRHKEIIPTCHCGHYRSAHYRSVGRCNKCNGASSHDICMRFSGGRYSEKGIPDLSGYFPVGKAFGPDGAALGFAVHFLIEVKRPGGRKREAQKEVIERAARSGVCAFFADSIDAMVAGFMTHGVWVRI